jgi:hypothetical protein
MSASRPLAALLALVLASPVFCQYGPCPVPYIPSAPDACGPGYYDVNPWFQPYGPNYNVYPPFAPFQGMIFPRQASYRPGAGGGAGNGNGVGGPPIQATHPGFVTHPYARSPRDFFMME